MPLSCVLKVEHNPNRMECEFTKYADPFIVCCIFLWSRSNARSFSYLYLIIIKYGVFLSFVPLFRLDDFAPPLFKQLPTTATDLCKKLFVCSIPSSRLPTLSSLSPQPTTQSTQTALLLRLAGAGDDVERCCYAAAPFVPYPLACPPPYLPHALPPSPTPRLLYSPIGPRPCSVVVRVRAEERSSPTS